MNRYTLVSTALVFVLAAGTFSKPRFQMRNKPKSALKLRKPPRQGLGLPSMSGSNRSSIDSVSRAWRVHSPFLMPAQLDVSQRPLMST
jgi:hypothetical protein